MKPSEQMWEKELRLLIHDSISWNSKKAYREIKLFIRQILSRQAKEIKEKLAEKIKDLPILKKE